MKTLLTTLALALAAGTLSAAPAAPAAESAATGSVHVALEVIARNNLRFAAGTLDGAPCRLLVDTGATHTTFDLAFVTNQFPSAKLVPVTLAGQTNVKTAPRYFPVGRFALGAHAFPSSGALALPLGELSARIGEPLDGVLGMSDLATVDFILRGGEIVLGPTDAERRGFGRDVHRGADAYSPTVAGVHDGREIELLVDSGSTFTFVDTKLWKASEESVALKATEVSGQSALTPRRGEAGVLDLGVPLTLRPMVAPRGVNYLGADVLETCDILFRARGRGIALRARASR